MYTGICDKCKISFAPDKPVFIKPTDQYLCIYCSSDLIAVLTTDNVALIGLAKDYRQACQDRIEENTLEMTQACNPDYGADLKENIAHWTATIAKIDKLLS